MMLRPLFLPLLAVLLVASGCASEDSPSWEPVTAQADSGQVPTTAVDPQSGTVYVSWIARPQGNPNVYLTRRPSEVDSLRPPVQVNQRAGAAHAHAQAPPQAAVGPSGTVYVAWVSSQAVDGRRFPATTLHLSRSTDGGRTFSKAVPVHSDADGPPSGHSFHDLTVGPEGTLYVSWLDSRRRDRARRDGKETNLPGTELRVARSTDRGRSFSERVVARGTCECCRTAVETDADGTVYVAWRHLFGENIRDVAVARSTDRGTSFSDPVRAHADEWEIEACPHSGPALALDDAGTLHLAWYTGAEGRAGLHYARSTDGGRSFHAPTALETDVGVSQVGLAAGPSGSVWMGWDNAEGGVTVARTAGGPSGGPESVSRLGGSFSGLAVASSHPVVAWTQRGTVRLSTHH